MFQSISNVFFSTVLLMSVFSLANASISFKNETGAAGISHSGPSFGASWGDLNNDGFPDLWVGNHYRSPSLYLNNGNGQFTDVANSVWPGPVRDSHGAAWGDFDRDGDEDLIEVSGGGQANQLWMNVGGVFYEALGIGADAKKSRSRTPMWFDWNLDGYLDLALSQAPSTGDSSFLLTNNAPGFSDSSISNGIDLNGTISTFLSDLTGNGRLDLSVLAGSSDSFPARAYDTSTLPFTLITGLDNLGAGVSDAVFEDFNGDLKTDIFTIRGANPNQLVSRSSTKIEFAMVAKQNEKSTIFSASGIVNIAIYPRSESQKVFIGSSGAKANSFYLTLDSSNIAHHGIAPHTNGVADAIYIGFDFQKSEWTISLSSPFAKQVNFVVNTQENISDIRAVGYKANPVHPWPSYLVRSDSGFDELRSQSGLGMGMPCFSVVGGDFDNDMDVDLFLACTFGVRNAANMLFENQGDGTFVRIANGGGASGSSFGRADSVVTADYNQDGFLDLFITNGEGSAPFHNGPHQLFKNAGNTNNWLEIDLVGERSNPAGVGSIVKVVAGGKAQVREQNSGTHRYSQNHQRLHFGLLNAGVIDEIEVTWPNGSKQTIYNVSINQILSIYEGDLDGDNDGVSNSLDNCPNTHNPYQGDLDKDGQGNACEEPVAKGYWLDFTDPHNVVHIYGEYFDTANNQVLVNGLPMAIQSVVDRSHIIANIPNNGSIVGPIRVVTSHGEDDTPATASFFDRGGGLIYDSILNVTWLYDANYSKTTLYDDDGVMTWPQALSWASRMEYFDAVRNTKWSDWRLPTALNSDQSGPCFGFDCSDSELGHLYYISGIWRASPGPFVNVKQNAYWTSTGRFSLPGTAWLFGLGNGQQDHTGPLEDILEAHAWAVRDGDVIHNIVGCGKPAYDKATEKGIFIWKDCLSDRWEVRVTGGGDGGSRYSGLVKSSPGNILSYDTFSYENNDLLNYFSVGGELRYVMNVWNNGEDGFAFTKNGDACFLSDIPDFDIYFGPSKLLILSASLDFDTQLPCVAVIDTDGDGLNDTYEISIGTDPNKFDTDGEGLSDGDEVNLYKTNPLHVNTDRDGINDYIEVTYKKTDPTNPDTDNDGLTDGEEASRSGIGTNPNNADTDGGGIIDGDEVMNGTDPFDPLDG